MQPWLSSSLCQLVMFSRTDSFSHYFPVYKSLAKSTSTFTQSVCKNTFILSLSRGKGSKSGKETPCGWVLVSADPNFYAECWEGAGPHWHTPQQEPGLAPPPGFTAPPEQSPELPATLWISKLNDS